MAFPESIALTAILIFGTLVITFSLKMKDFTKIN